MVSAGLSAWLGAAQSVLTFVSTRRFWFIILAVITGLALLYRIAVIMGGQARMYLLRAQVRTHCSDWPSDRRVPTRRRVLTLRRVLKLRRRP